MLTITSQDRLTRPGVGHYRPYENSFLVGKHTDVLNVIYMLKKKLQETFNGDITRTQYTA